MFKDFNFSGNSYYIRNLKMTDNKQYYSNNQLNFTNSLVNDFIPLSAIFTGKRVVVGDKIAISYNLSVTRASNCNSFSSITQFSKMLLEGYSSWNRYTKKGETNFRVRQGQLVEVIWDEKGEEEIDYKPLITVVVQKDYALTFDPSPLQVDLNKIFVAVSRDFIEDKKYSVLYKSIKKNYLDEIEIDMLVVRDIKSICYKEQEMNPFIVSSVSEYRDVISDFNQQLFASLREML